MEKNLLIERIIGYMLANTLLGALFSAGVMFIEKNMWLGFAIICAYYAGTFIVLGVAENDLRNLIDDEEESC